MERRVAGDDGTQRRADFSNCRGVCNRPKQPSVERRQSCRRGKRDLRATPPPTARPVTVRPNRLFNETFMLDENERHRWRPIAPCARVEVEMDAPSLSWSGDGYFDHNNGDEPLEAGFTDWDWSRAHQGGDTIIRYEARTRSRTTRELALRFGDDGAVEEIDTANAYTLPPTTIWRAPRRTRSETDPRVIHTLEDTPFYARSLIETTYNGERLRGFHESLDLDRFSMPVIQGMLPFRMPRKAI